MDELSFFDYLSPFCFLLIEFHCSFSISYKILPDYVYYCCISIRIGCRDFFQSCPLYFFSMLTPLFCPSSSVSVSYFILSVPMREWLGKHSCMSSPFPIAILNCTSFLSLVKENINMPSGLYYRLCS